MLSVVMADLERPKQAKSLVKQILRLARTHDHKALLKIADDAEAVSLLALLPDRESAQALAHLEGARIWRAKGNRKAEEKIAAATDALGELDLVLARGITRKIDPELLGETELARYDDLVLAIEARAMELEEIQSRLPQDQASSPRPKKERRRRGFFGR